MVYREKIKTNRICFIHSKTQESNDGHLYFEVIK